jgi:glycoside/pentoside/hexuronide:cation symporter, GPH family
MSPKRLPLSQLLIYAAGQLGWSLAAYGAANLLVYFYLPPGDGQSQLFPAFIFQGAVAGIVTLIGLINFGGRLFDAVTDPIVAAWADRRPSERFGRRKKIMAMAALPLALSSFALFYPPYEAMCWQNTAWLSCWMLVFYASLTLYVIPYNALISELGHYPPDRMRISTAISITFALGFLIGGSIYAVQDWLTAIMPVVQAFQWAVGGFSLLALLLLLVPVCWLKENEYAQQAPALADNEQAGLLRTVLSNNSFRIFLLSEFMYWLALTFIQMGIGFFVTILLDYPPAQATLFLTASFLGSFALYWPVNKLVDYRGKRKVMLSAYWVFAGTFALLALSPWISVPGSLLFWTLSLSASYPLAVFGIVPNAMVADFIHDHKEATGGQPAGMFFAVFSFIMKAGVSVANLIFPSLLLLGKSVDNSLGVQLAAWLALLSCVLGALLFYRIRPSSHDKAVVSNE